MIVLWILLGLALLVLAISFVCFYIAFFVPKHSPIAADDYTTPEGPVYAPFREQMVQWMREVRALPHEDCYITSFDGLKLHGRY